MQITFEREQTPPPPLKRVVIEMNGEDVKTLTREFGNFTTYFLQLHAPTLWALYNHLLKGE